MKRLYYTVLFLSLGASTLVGAQPRLESLAGPQKALPESREVVCKDSWDAAKCERIKSRFEEIQTFRRAQRAKLNLLKSRHQELQAQKQKAKTIEEINALELEAQNLLKERDDLRLENEAFNEKIKAQIKQEALSQKQMSASESSLVSP